MANMQGLPSLQEQAMAKHPPIPAPKGSELPYDLAQMLAKQKVLKAAIDAEAQRMLQQSQGQGGKPPTVDQSLNQKLAQLLAPPQQQAGPDLQQAALGPGMNNQGAAPPNGGAIPQPQQAPQAMAAGGLARLPSNLPQSYAGGGIIAFAGANPDGTPSDQKVPNGDEDNESYVDPYSGETIDPNAKHKFHPVDAIYEAAKRAADAIAEERRKPPLLDRIIQAQEEKERFAANPTANYSNEGREPPSVASTPASTPAPTGNRPNMAAHTAGPTDVETAAPRAAPPRDKRPSVAQGSGSAPAASTGFGLGDLSSKLLGRVNAGIGEDPATAERDITARYSAAVGDKEKALRALQLTNLQKQQEADASQLKAADPESWGRWLSRFDPHSRFLGEGVAAKTYAERDAYEGMKQKQLAGLRALQEAQATGELGDVKGRFELGDKERTAAEVRRAGYTKDATTLFDTGATNATHLEVSKNQLAQHVQAASNAIAHDDKMAAISAEKSLGDQITRTQTALLNLAMDEPTRAGYMQELKQAKAELNNMRRQFMAKFPGYTPLPDAPAPAPQNTDAVLAELARRKGK